MKMYFLDGTVMPFEHKVGPRLVGDYRGVTPSQMKKLSDLMLIMLQNGCQGAVVHGTRLERGISEFLGNNTRLLSDPNRLDSLPFEFANHIMSNFKMLRYMVAEDESASSLTRRYPRSGGFRRTMRSSDWEWVRPLMDLVKHTGSENLHGFEKLLDADAEVEVDEEGWPTIFKTFMASCKDGKEEEDDAEDREGADEEGADNMSVGKSVVSMSRNSSCRTLLYDDEGFPHCFWPPHAEPCSTTTLEEQQTPANDDDVVGDDDLKPIVPRARARKAQAKAVKKKPAAKPVVPAHVPLVLGCSKCRYVPTRCGQCKNPSFGGHRGPRPNKALTT